MPSQVLPLARTLAEATFANWRFGRLYARSCRMRMCWHSGFGIPYESIWGHRGITHSFFFAALLSSLLVLTIFKASGPRRFQCRCCLWKMLQLLTLLACTDQWLGVGCCHCGAFSVMSISSFVSPDPVSPIGAGVLLGMGLRVLKAKGCGLPTFDHFGSLIATILRKSATNAEWDVGGHPIWWLGYLCGLPTNSP